AEEHDEMLQERAADLGDRLGVGRARKIDAGDLGAERGRDRRYRDARVASGLRHCGGLAQGFGTSLPVSTSHTLITVSKPPETMRLPSGVKATAKTPLSWPKKRRTRPRAAMSQSTIVRSP